jgi:hypothetical protein
MVRKASETIPENVMVVFYNDTGDDVENMKGIERLARQKGAIMGLPLTKSIIPVFQYENARFDKLIRGFLSYASKELFSITNPDIANLDRTRAVLMDKARLERVALQLNRMLAPAASYDLLNQSAYNLRMTAVARQTMEFSGISKETILNAADQKRVISVRADTLAELKMLAEAHRDRMSLARNPDKGSIPVKLEVRLAVSENERRAIEKDLPSLLERMGVAEILSADDVILVKSEEAESVKAIYERLAATEKIQKENIVVVDRAREGREGSDIPEGAAFIEYTDKFITSYHYDAILDAIARPNDPALSDKYKRWLRIRPIEVIDFDQLQREVEQYQKVLMAA